MENTDKVEEIQVVVVAPEKTWSETFSDQDFKQKVNMYISFITEVQRALMGSFLILFVPQKCGDHICGMGDNISTGNNLIDSAFGFNIIVCTLILHMYYAEIRRETKMIDYLHINPELPRDNDAVGDALVKLPEHNRDAIWWWDNYYKRSGQVAMLGYIVNMVLSGIVILKDHYLDDKTLTVFITNGLFMGLKLIDTQTITATDKNIFLSAYLTRRIQYNDVDPDKMIELVKTEYEEEIKVEELESNNV